MFIYENKFERKILHILITGVELDDWILMVRYLDCQNGGFGAHNLNGPYHDIGKGITGTYKIPDRAVYRGL